MYIYSAASYSTFVLTFFWISFKAKDTAVYFSIVKGIVFDIHKFCLLSPHRIAFLVFIKRNIL